MPEHRIVTVEFQVPHSEAPSLPSAEGYVHAVLELAAMGHQLGRLSSAWKIVASREPSWPR